MQALTITLCFLAITSRALTEPPYFIIVRLPSDSYNDPLSAQFQQLFSSDHHPAPEWKCKSGLTPITFPHGEQVTNAKSMDLEVGSVVECLGLVVTVVAGREVRLWRGEATQCGQSHQATTHELTRTTNKVSETFKLLPETEFSVYSAEPTADCITQSINYVDPPKLVFRFQKSESSKCSVVSNDLSVVKCNMTISAGSKGTVAMATGTTEINVPDFIWQMDAKTIRCSCTCGIKTEFSTSSSVITTSINYNNSVSDEEEAEEGSYQEEEEKIDLNLLLLILGVLSAMLLSSISSTVFFFNLARSLKRKLNKAKKNPFPPPAPPSFQPPVQYSRVHRITNECHHYNTVSLELSNCLGLDAGKGSTTGSDRPVYQKLRSNEADDVEL